MRYLFCLVFIMMTLFALSMPIKAESPKEDVTLMIIATSNANYEFLVLQASHDLISWSFYRDDRSKNEKGEFDSKYTQSREGKVAGKAERLTAAFSKVLNLEKQIPKSPQNPDQSRDDYVSPYDFALILMDSTGVKACQLSHKQQVELSHCEELKPIFDITRTKVAGDKRMMMPDLFYAGHNEYLRETTSRINNSSVPEFPSVPAPRNK